MKLPVLCDLLVDGMIGVVDRQMDGLINKSDLQGMEGVRKRKREVRCLHFFILNYLQWACKGFLIFKKITISLLPIVPKTGGQAGSNISLVDFFKRIFIKKYKVILYPCHLTFRGYMST